MPARPLMPNVPQPMSPAQHAQFDPSATEQLLGQVKGQVIARGLGKVMPGIETAVTDAAAPLTNALGITKAAAPVATAAPAAIAETLAATATPLASAATAAPVAAGTGMMAAAAPFMAAAAPIAIPAAIAAKVFGLFNQGGRVPSETMTAQAPQQNMASTQANGPLSFKHAEIQQKLALKQATFDADQKRKEEAHRIAMHYRMKKMQQQQKLTEAASGFQTPLSAR